MTTFRSRPCGRGDPVGPVGEHSHRSLVTHAADDADHPHAPLSEPDPVVPGVRCRVEPVADVGDLAGQLVPHLMTQLTPLLHLVDERRLGRHPLADAVSGLSGSGELTCRRHLD